MSRPTCSVFVGTSLDGFIAGPGGELDWLKPFEGQEHGYQPFFDAVDAVVIGRATYDVVLGFGAWPYGGKRVFVLTHRPGPARNGEVFLSGTPEEVVARLAAAGVRRAYVDGGAVVSQFLAAGLVDDLTLTLVPLVLGDGIRLFQAPLPARPMRLAGSRTYPSGLVQVRYLAAGEARRTGRRVPGVESRGNARRRTKVSGAR